MKKLLLLLITIAITYISIAQGSNFTRSTTGQYNLKIRFNGKKYSLQDKSATFQNITPGTYPLIVYQWSYRNNSAGEWIKVFDNNVTLTAYKHLEITVMRFGKTTWDEGPIAIDSWWDGTINPVGGTGTGNNSQAIDDYGFGKIKKAIKDAVYASDMLTMAKGVMKNNLFTVDQIIELCRLFTYSSDRLAFAKYGYDYCINKNLYFTVADVFTYSSDKSELMAYINGK
jgi:hypothetical protein